MTATAPTLDQYRKAHDAVIISLVQSLFDTQEYRALLLATLCLTGRPVAEVVKLRWGDLFENISTFNLDGSVRNEMWRLQEKGWPKTLPFDLVARRYLRTLQPFLRSRVSVEAPVFPSREGDGAISCRTAERTFADSQKDVASKWTLRDIRHIGLRWIHQTGGVRVLSSRDFTWEYAIRSADWFLRKISKSEHEYEDIRQAVLLSLLQIRRKDSPIYEADVVTVARSIKRQMRQGVPISVGDLKFLEEFPAEERTDAIQMSRKAKAKVAPLMRRLDPLTRDVVERSFGLRLGVSEPYSTIARDLGLSEPKARAIARRGIISLRSRHRIVPASIVEAP